MEFGTKLIMAVFGGLEKAMGPSGSNVRAITPLNRGTLNASAQANPDLADGLFNDLFDNRGDHRARVETGHGAPQVGEGTVRTSPKGGQNRSIAYYVRWNLRLWQVTTRVNGANSVEPKLGSQHGNTEPSRYNSVSGVCRDYGLRIPQRDGDIVQTSVKAEGFLEHYLHYLTNNRNDNCRQPFTGSPISNGGMLTSLTRRTLNSSEQANAELNSGVSLINAWRSYSSRPTNEGEDMTHPLAKARDWYVNNLVPKLNGYGPAGSNSGLQTPLTRRTLNSSEQANTEPSRGLTGLRACVEHIKGASLVSADGMMTCAKPTGNRWGNLNNHRRRSPLVGPLSSNTGTGLTLIRRTLKRFASWQLRAKQHAVAEMCRDYIGHIPLGWKHSPPLGESREKVHPDSAGQLWQGRVALAIG